MEAFGRILVLVLALVRCDGLAPAVLAAVTLALGWLELVVLSHCWSRRCWNSFLLAHLAEVHPHFQLLCRPTTWTTLQSSGASSTTGTHEQQNSYTNLEFPFCSCRTSSFQLCQTYCSTHYSWRDTIFLPCIFFVKVDYTPFHASSTNAVKAAQVVHDERKEEVCHSAWFCRCVV